MPYVQFESIGDFIPEPRCSKFVVGLQTRGSKMGVQEVRSDSGPKGLERRDLLRALSVRTSVVRWNRWMVVRLVRESILAVESSLFWRERIPFYR